MWRAGLSSNGGPSAEATIARIRECLADDLDAPGALAAVDAWANESLELAGRNLGELEIGAPGMVARAIDALLGIRL
jgi:L-cysteine:1D-myo-inositol 2-amino-2-deoxy-alpha-D-glucopyranoside ligase